MAKCYIAFGGNTGAVLQAFSAALAHLCADPNTQLIARSRLYITEAMQLPTQHTHQPHYYNAVCAFHTTLTPMTLLQKLQALEDHFGHNRNMRWAPRTLDLDLLTYDAQCIQTHTLTIPHPGLTQRAFVLLPLADIAADMIIAATQQTVQQHLARMQAPYNNIIQIITLW